LLKTLSGTGFDKGLVIGNILKFRRDTLAATTAIFCQ
jgi:hypothetical protein